MNDFYDQSTIREGVAYNPQFSEVGEYPNTSFPTYKKAPQTARRVTSGFCSCVVYIKQKYGFSVGSIGYARNWPKNAVYPSVGGVVITSEGYGTGHVAAIVAIQDGYLILDEANYQKCRQTSDRKLPIDSPLIKGYWVNN